MKVQQSDIFQEIKSQIRKEYESTVKIYQHIHQCPQIGLQQYNTSTYIRDILAHVEGLIIEPILQAIPTAIIAKITVSNPIKTVLIRSELDALNFIEKSGLPFASKNNLHHACGHDGHMASLITTIKIIAKYRQKLNYNIVFCFQPGQEGKEGARKLFEANPMLLQNVDQCYALHFNGSSYVGTINLNYGPVTALSARFQIEIIGVSTHCMVPHSGVDANLIGCMLVTQLYSLIGIKIPILQGGSLVIYKIEGGQSVAKISDKFEIAGSLRVMTIKSFEKMKQAITTISNNICQSYGATCTINFKQSPYRPVVNDQSLVFKTKKKLENWIDGLKIVPQQKSFAGQDFCQFSERKPSCYISVGSAYPESIDPLTNQTKFPLHSPFHKFDKNVFKISTQVWPAIIFQK